MEVKLCYYDGRSGWMWMVGFWFAVKTVVVADKDLLMIVAEDEQLVMTWLWGR